MMSINEHFGKQLGIIRNCMCDNLILLGDFNLDANKDLSRDYSYRIPMNALSDLVLECNMLQIIDFPTWSRTVRNVKKESLLDHIYVTNVACITTTMFETPIFGDHLLVMAALKSKLTQAEAVPPQSRSWKNYSSCEMNVKLSVFNEINVKYLYDNCNVQEMWNVIETWIIDACDEAAPLVDQLSKMKTKNLLPPIIKYKFNKRKNLLKKQKQNFSIAAAATIRLLNNNLNMKGPNKYLKP